MLIKPELNSDWLLRPFPVVDAQERKHAGTVTNPWAKHKMEKKLKLTTKKQKKKKKFTAHLKYSSICAVTVQLLQAKGRAATVALGRRSSRSPEDTPQYSGISGPLHQCPSEVFTPWPKEQRHSQPCSRESGRQASPSLLGERRCFCQSRQTDRSGF